MRKYGIILTLIWLLIGGSVTAQLITYQKGSKTGIRYHGDKIYRPRKDSIVIKDDSIATIYRKRKTIYLNYLGEKVFKDKVQNGTVFSFGSALIQDKDGKWAAINRKGEYIFDHFYLEQPEKYKSIIITTFGNSIDLYNDRGVLEFAADSVKWMKDWLIVYTDKDEYVTITKKRLLRKDIEKTVKREVNFMNIYDADPGVKIASEIKSIDSIGQFMILTQIDDKTTILHKTEAFTIDDVHSIRQINDNYFSFKKKAVIHLVDRSLAQVIFSGIFDRVEVQGDYLHALIDSTNQSEFLTVIDHSGQIISENLFRIRPISGNRFVYQKDSLQFIGDLAAHRMSKMYHAVGDASEGYRLIYYEHSYGYISDETYEELPIRYPIIAQEYDAVPQMRRGGDFIRAIMEGFSNLGRVLVGKDPVKYLRYRPGKPGGIRLKETGREFNDGWAAVCLYEYNAAGSYDSIPVLGPFEKVKYNYVNTKGEYLNNERYSECRDFKNGHAWVKKDGYYYLIDTTGNKAMFQQFTNIRTDENGYTIAKFRWEDYLIDPNYKVVAKCECFNLTLVDSAYYDIEFKDSTLIYQLPLVDSAEAVIYSSP